MIYYATVLGTEVNAVQQGLIAAYGPKLDYASPDPSNIGQNSPNTELEISLNDNSITADDVGGVITNAIGSYTQVGTQMASTVGNSTGLFDLGNFFNKIGAGLRALLPNINLPNFWLIAVVILAIVLLVFFGANFSKGFGQGLAARGA